MTHCLSKHVKCSHPAPENRAIIRWTQLLCTFKGKAIKLIKIHVRNTFSLPSEGPEGDWPWEMFVPYDSRRSLTTLWQRKLGHPPTPTKTNKILPQWTFFSEPTTNIWKENNPYFKSRTLWENFKKSEKDFPCKCICPTCFLSNRAEGCKRVRK